MDTDSKRNAFAAACILLAFGLGAYFMPTIMLAVGEYSTAVAAVIAVLFVAAFFLLFWLRGRSRGGH